MRGPVKQSVNRSRGFVLVNALVLVTALAAVAALLLTRAGSGRAQLAANTEAAQLEAYLDAFEVLALSLIDSDPGPVDHLGEAWARADYRVPLDRGHVAGGLVDLQAGFNVNLMANPSDGAALAAFGRLIGRLGASPQTGEMIFDILSSGGPERPIFWEGVENQMPGGALGLIAQLPLPERDRKLLAPFLVALPGDALVNVNTAPIEVLAAFLPDLGQAELAGLIQQRDRIPFASTEAFTDLLAGRLSEEAAEALELRPRFSVGSDWFAAEITAGLEGRQARRRVILHRQPLPERAEVAYRLDRW